LKRTVPLLFAAMAVILAACGTPPAAPEDHYYRLQLAAPKSPLAAEALRGTLEIKPFIGDGLAAGRPIVYSHAGKPQELREYHYHFWTQPPTIMLQDQLVTYLRAAKVAGMVVTPEMRVEPEYILVGKIKRLERIVGTPSKAALELELGLRQTKSGAIVLLKTYGLEVAAQGNSVADAVAALNRALSEIYAKFTADVSAI
jgi:cholesterol transport system auxiliary component